MAEVFISYKAERRAYAERLALILEANGYDVWWDYQLLPGARFRKEILSEIDASSAVVVLWCAGAIESDFVVDEADHARKGKKLIQLTIEPIDPPLGFRSSDHRLDLSSWQGNVDHELIAKLLKSISAYVGRPPRQAPTLHRALAASLGPLRHIEDALGSNDTSSQRVIDTSAQSTIRSRPTNKNREKTFFEACETADELQNYLSRYPHGAYVQDARSKLAGLDKAWVDQLSLTALDWSFAAPKELIQKLGPRAARAELEPRAQRDVAEALTILAFLLKETGHNEEYLRLLSRASDLGFARARAELGFKLVRGEGIDTDIKRGNALLEAAALQGNAIAQADLGRSFEKGLGLAADSERALNWYLKAAEQGYGKAEFHIGYLYDETLEDVAQAVIWYEKAAAKNEPLAICNLGVMYATGRETAVDYERAKTLFKTAAELGSAAAQFNLGYMHEVGLGSAKDLKTAIRWYQRAAAQDYNLAEIALSRLGIKSLET